MSFKASKQSLDFCLKNHRRPMVYFERGAFCFLEGQNLDALEYIHKAMNLGLDLESLKDSAILLKAQMESELGLYLEAIDTLSALIQKDPLNKEAYFERASAYFEVGDFDLALTDYLSSDYHFSKPDELAGNTALFALGLFGGAVKGTAEAAIEFIPSILSSAYGLGTALWAFSEDPIQVSKKLAEATYDCIELIKQTSLNEITEE